MSNQKKNLQQLQRKIVEKARKKVDRKMEEEKVLVREISVGGNSEDYDPTGIQMTTKTT